MKCPTCESCDYAKYCGATEIMRKCERHNKKVPMTNEEWLNTLDTMPKAIWLSKIAEKCKDDFRAWRDWLEAVHKEVSE